MRQQAEACWINHYNNKRPNMGNGGFTPIQKLNMADYFYLFSVLNMEVFFFDQLAEWYGHPKQIFVDNSSEFTSYRLTD